MDNTTNTIDTSNLSDYESSILKRIGSVNKPVEPVNSKTDKVMSVVLPIAKIIEALATSGKGSTITKSSDEFNKNLLNKKELYSKKLGLYNTESDLLNKSLFDARNKILENRLNVDKKDIEKTKQDLEGEKFGFEKEKFGKSELEKAPKVKYDQDRITNADTFVSGLNIKDNILREAVKQQYIDGKDMKSIYDMLHPKETDKKKDDGNNPIRALDIANAGLEDINKIRSSTAKESYFTPLSGTVRGLNFITGGKSFSGTKSADLEANIDALKSKLTTANLDLMKGVLSNTDIKILTRAATSLSKNTTLEQFMNELDRVENVFIRNKANLEKLVPVEQRVVPLETKKNRTWNPKSGKVE